MSVPHDPYRQQQQAAVRQAPATVRNVPGGPQQPAPPREPTQPMEGPEPLTEQLRTLDREDLVDLAGRHGLDTYRVRSDYLVDQLADMGVGPDSQPPSGGMTGVVGPQ